MTEDTGWDRDGEYGFVQREGSWTHKAGISLDGQFEFVATQHRGTDYVVKVPPHVIFDLVESWREREELLGAVSPAGNTRTLWRPVGQEELLKIEGLGWAAFPPRLPDQNIFYPVCTERYACEIARNWNARDGQKGYVLQFDVGLDYLKQYTTQAVGGRTREEYWIPAADLPAFNKAIVGGIRVVQVF